ncbi:MAG: GntR family transcriptional regulator [Desulfarculus sp.]|jgi:DNA-binding GntR family transcriptional regulator|nr:MAG: GntR family transcriptional regulator [Desulfarculus sp.]
MKLQAADKGKTSANKRGLAIEEAYLKIKNMIYLNRLAPGQKIVYGDLGQRLNISITPVIQALNRLEASGFVTYVPNKGYFVGEITEEEALELYAAREALELYLIPNIIKNIDNRTIEQIRASFKKHSDQAQNQPSRKIILVDAQFHLKLAEFGGNEVIERLLREVFEKLYLKYRPEYLEAPRVKEVAAEHRAILDALRWRDAQKAAVAIRTHIWQSKERVTKQLRLRQEGGLL